MEIYKVHPALNTDCYCNYSSYKWKRKTLTTGSPAKYFVFAFYKVIFHILHKLSAYQVCWKKSGP